MNQLARIALFLIGCIGTRSALVYIAKTLSPEYLQYMGYLALLPAFGFIFLWVTGTRKTGAEVFGEKIWWNSLRPVHGLLYLAFAYNAIRQNPNSWLYLLADVIFGLVSYFIRMATKIPFHQVFAAVG